MTKWMGFDLFAGGAALPMAWWRQFDPAVFRRHLEHCREALPGANCARIWLSYGAWQRDSRGVCAAWEQALECCADLGLGVVACLFARTRAEPGGERGELNLERILPGVGWAYRRSFFLPYLGDMAGPYRDDPRILHWDLCDRPFPWGGEHTGYYDDEKALLRELYFTLRGFGATQPAGPVWDHATPDKMRRDNAEICDSALAYLPEGDPGRQQADRIMLCPREPATPCGGWISTAAKFAVKEEWK